MTKKELSELWLVLQEVNHREEDGDDEIFQNHVRRLIGVVERDIRIGPTSLGMQ